MLISVIIPVYNTASFLKECVESVLNQDENLEIILINDGSKDDSGALCDKLAKENANIKVYLVEIKKISEIINDYNNNKLV